MPTPRFDYLLILLLLVIIAVSSYIAAISTNLLMFMVSFGIAAIASGMIIGIMIYD